MRYRSHKCYPYGSDESQLSNPKGGLGQPVYPSSEGKEIEIYKSQDWFLFTPLIPNIWNEHFDVTKTCPMNAKKEKQNLNFYVTDTKLYLLGWLITQNDCEIPPAPKGSGSPNHKCVTFFSPVILPRPNWFKPWMTPGLKRRNSREAERRLVSSTAG